MDLVRGLTREIHHKEKELGKLEAQLDGLRIALKAVSNGIPTLATGEPKRPHATGYKITHRGLTGRIIEYLTKTGTGATPQQLWSKGFEGKDFSSLKACLTSAVVAGKLTRKLNTKGFYEYSAAPRENS